MIEHILCLHRQLCAQCLQDLQLKAFTGFQHFQAASCLAVKVKHKTWVTVAPVTEKDLVTFIESIYQQFCHMLKKSLPFPVVELLQHTSSPAMQCCTLS